MSQFAALYAADRGIFRPADSPPPLSRFRVNWFQLLDHNGYWPLPLSVDQAFQAYAWAMERSFPEREAAYTPAGLACGTGAVHVRPMSSGSISDHWPTHEPVKFLAQAFTRLVQNFTPNSSAIQAWRERVGIHLSGDGVSSDRVIITRPAYTHDGGPVSNHSAEERLGRLLSCEGRGLMHEQHNSCHSKARWPQYVAMTLAEPYGEGDDPDARRAAWQAYGKERDRRGRWALAWRFDLIYGYPPPDGSSWSVHLVTQQAGETFVEAMLRAEKRLAEMTAEAPERSPKEWALTERIVRFQVRAARMWGAPEAAIRSGVRFSKDDGGYTLDVGGSAWRCRWDAKHGKHGSSFVGSDDIERAADSAQRWAPDWRLDTAAGTVRDWDGDVLPVRLGESYAEPWRGPFGYPGWVGAPPGCELQWFRYIRRPSGHLVLGAEIRRVAGRFKVFVRVGARPTGNPYTAITLDKAGGWANTGLASERGLVMLNSMPDPGQDRTR